MKVYMLLWLSAALNHLYTSVDTTDLIWNTETNELSIANTFSGCLIHIINFQGLNVNVTSITEPVVLLCYFSFPTQELLYPIESIPVTINHISRRLQSLNFTLFKSGIKIKLSNKTVLFTRNESNSYIESTLNVKKAFRLSAKNSNCEANVYLYPPSRTSYPSLYIKYLSYGLLLKDPFWIFHSFNSDANEKWRYTYMNSIPKYSIRVCDELDNSISYKVTDQTIWISTVLYNPY